MSEPLDLDAIEARLAGTAGGDWWTYTGIAHDGVTLTRGIASIALPSDECVLEDPDMDPADAEFIAHARTDVPALVARVRELTPRVLEGDWETVRDALDALPEGAQIRWRANGRRALPTLGIKVTNVMGHASWSTTGLGILKATTIARDETPIEVIA